MKLNPSAWIQRGIVLGAFVILLYFIIATVLVPDLGFAFEWTATPDTPLDAATTFRLPAGVLRVIDVSSDHEVADLLQVGDTMQIISGVQPQQSPDWRSVLGGVHTKYDLTVLRDGRSLQLNDLPVAKSSLAGLFERFMLGMIALVTWVVGALMLAHARKKQRDARTAGYTMVAAGVSLAAFGGQQYGVAWSWLGSVPVLPLLALAIVQTSLLPRCQAPSVREVTLFRTLYGLAGIVAGLAVADILWFQPRGESLRLGGMWIYYWCLVALAAGLTANPLILLFRMGRLNKGYLRKQITILLFFTGTAVLPFVFLTFLPDIFFNYRVLPQELTLLLLTLIPLGYGYVIYRWRYLNLDFVVMRTLPTLLLSLVMVIIYSLAIFFFSDLSSLSMPWVSVVLFGAVSLGPWAIHPFFDLMQALIFGRTSPDQKTLHELTNHLAVSPELGSLQQVLRHLPSLVGVSQSALLVLDKHGQYLIDAQGIVMTGNSLSGLDALLMKEYVLRAEEDRTYTDIFLLYAWAQVLLPLRLGDKLLGILLLGAPVPDGHYNARQIDVLTQFGRVLAVTVETILLYESTRDMAMEMLAVRDAERNQIAMTLHDGPVQDITIALSDVPAENTMLRAQLRRIANQLREMVAGLHSPILKQSLARAIQEVAEEFERTHHLPVHVINNVPVSVQPSLDIGNAFYHVLQESLQNVHKHAHAASVEVRLTYEKGRLCMSVADDGEGDGLPAHLTIPALIRQRHFGLVGMQQRTQLLGGQWSMARNEKGGVTVSIAVLLQRPPVNHHVGAAV